mgnify:FL=1
MNKHSRVCANIDLSAVMHNMEAMHQNIDPNTKIMAVIKADGYGHGAVPIAKEIEHLDYVYGYAAATVEEGMILRNNGIQKPILILGYIFPDQYEEVIQAAKMSHSWEFIRRLPDGLDTILYEDSLSQGQKQLLCITRVMLCLPPMLILDEATSSIDTRTEMLIQEAFDRMMQGRTSFIVAHRLSTIRNADEILVMKDGSIIEQGSHEELMAKGGFYQNLYNSQFVKVSE